MVLHITSFVIFEAPQASLDKENPGVSRLETSDG